MTFRKQKLSNGQTDGIIVAKSYFIKVEEENVNYGQMDNFTYEIKVKCNTATLFIYKPITGHVLALISCKYN